MFLHIISDHHSVGNLYSQNIDLKRSQIRQNRIRFHPRAPCVHKNHLRNFHNARNRLCRGSQNRIVISTPVRTRQKHRRVEESSDSEVEYAPKKLTSLAISRKSNKSSLKSRLSNMIKYSSNVGKCKRRKSSTSANTRKLDNESSNSLNNYDESPNKRIQTANDAGQNDMSDEDLDTLRELALKSKVKRNEKLSENQYDIEMDLQKNNSDDMKLKLDVDKELEELRLVALKSAILKKASKRKKVKRDDKRSKKERRSVSIFEPETELTGVTCPTDLMLDTNTENLMYDYNNIYQFYFPLLRNGENNIVDPSNSNKENNEIKESNETEDEELLRSHLLASMENNRKMPSSCVSIEPPKNKFENDSDSNLIVRLGGSDTESECETTKNLALMHKKLSCQTEFQRNLEVFLKGARQSVTEKDLIALENRSRLTHSNTMLIQNPSEQLMVENFSYRNIMKVALMYCSLL